MSNMTPIGKTKGILNSDRYITNLRTNVLVGVDIYICFISGRCFIEFPLRAIFQKSTVDVKKTLFMKTIICTHACTLAPTTKYIFSRFAC